MGVASASQKQPPSDEGSTLDARRQAHLRPEMEKEVARVHLQGRAMGFAGYKHQRVVKGRRGGGRQSHLETVKGPGPRTLEAKSGLGEAGRTERWGRVNLDL